MVNTKDWQIFEAEFKELKQHLDLQKKENKERRKAAISPEDKDIIDGLLEQIQCEEEYAKFEKNEREIERKKITAKLRKAKLYLAKVDTRGVLNKDVRIALEREVLEPMGSEKSSYHGGDYEGKGAKNFMKKARDIFDSTSMFLHRTSRQKHHVTCTDEMISQVCDLYGRLFQYYNAIRYLARKRNGTATNEDVALMKIILKKQRS